MNESDTFVNAAWQARCGIVSDVLWIKSAGIEIYGRVDPGTQHGSSVAA